jgi:hypothetical protein
MNETMTYLDFLWLLHTTDRKQIKNFDRFVVPIAAWFLDSEVRKLLEGVRI